MLFACMACTGNHTPSRRAVFSVCLDEYRSRTLAGWHTPLDALAATLDGRETDLVNLPGWAENHAAYEAQTD